MSKVYPFTAYDKHMSLKLDSNMWLIIVYFLRPFIMKISTIQMGRGAKSDSGGEPRKISKIAGEAKSAGIEMAYVRFVPNTVNSHRLLHFALTHHGRKLQNILADRLFVAHFVESRNLSDLDVLVDCAKACGMDEEKVKQYLQTIADTELIITQNNDARSSHAMTGVPVFIFNNKFKMPGAQDEAVFLNVFRRLKERGIVYDANASPPSL